MEERMNTVTATIVTKFSFTIFEKYLFTVFRHACQKVLKNESYSVQYLQNKTIKMHAYNKKTKDS